MTVKRYTTESGSVWTIDFENKTWERIKGKSAATIRSDSGKYETIAIGDNLLLTCPSYQNEEWRGKRLLISTNIVKEEDVKSKTD